MQSISSDSLESGLAKTARTSVTCMNSRFSMAVHILTFLASQPEDRLTSGLIAASVGTNPVVIRRQLGLLRKANLVRSRGARGGGWMLARKPESIALSEVRKALGPEAEFRMHRNDPHPDCVIGQHVREALQGVYQDAESAVTKSLSHWTVKDMLKQTWHAAGRPKAV